MGMAQVVECLPSKCEALSLIPTTTKKRGEGGQVPSCQLFHSLEDTTFLQDSRRRKKDTALLINAHGGCTSEHSGTWN
jgi:hypothetical protein